MKILVDGRVLKHECKTGVERYTIEILKAFDKIGVQYKLLFPFSKNRYFQHIWEHIMLPINSKNYDILFCPGNICPIFKFKNVKYVVVIHDLAPIYYPQTYARQYMFYYRLLTPLVIKVADRIITCSETIKKEILKKYLILERKVVAIPNGINEEFLNRNQQISSNKSQYILYVGSLNPRKNLIGVLKAFQKLLTKIPHHLYIVGGEFRIYAKDKNLKDLLEKLPKDRIKFLGYVTSDNELKKFYVNSSCLIFPSFYEGSGLPPTEAMACGCPVIVSDIEALRERCGDAAYYVNPYDIESIANGIYQVITNISLRETLIRKGFERVKNFSWETTAKKILKVFEETLLQ
ncbi:MAG: glycosyltransferase family 1 protein [Candidatus Micrarchaeia archaeon]